MSVGTPLNENQLRFIDEVNRRLREKEEICAYDWWDYQRLIAKRDGEMYGLIPPSFSFTDANIAIDISTED